MRKLGKVLIVVAVLLGVCIGMKYLTQKNKNQDNFDFLAGIPVMTEEEWTEYLKQTPSDLEGISRYEKREMGLDDSKGSDSDQDGLTDKEEIEVYHSDPLAASTAGDLYFDSYKVENGMDLHTYYEYKEEIVFVGNECPEVILDASLPSDLYAIVEDATEYCWLDKFKVYKTYSIYNYGNKLCVDLSGFLTANNLSMKDIKVYVCDGFSLKEGKFTIEQKSIVLNDNLNVSMSYYVFVVKNNLQGSINCRLKGINSIINPPNIDTGKNYGYLSGSPLIALVKPSAINVYCENAGNLQKTETLKKSIMQYINKSVMGLKTVCSLENIEIKTQKEIMDLYTDTQKKYPTFEYNGDKENLKWWHYLYCYHLCEIQNEDFSHPNSSEPNDIEKIPKKFNFDIAKDALPFENFASYVSPEGNCAGIAHLTSYLYNTGTLPDTGSYKIKNEGTIKWNISNDEENKTLLDKGLYDYQNSSFIIDNEIDGIIDKTALDNAQIEFFNMVGCFWAEANEHIKLSDYTKFNNLFNTDYSFSMIENIIYMLDKDKIIDIYFLLESGAGHAVNIYSYHYDTKNKNKIWFEVYDNNIPYCKLNEYDLKYGNKCMLEITKKKDIFTGEYTFEYDYHPVIGNDNYRATSNVLWGKPYCMIAVDENWNIIE